MPRFRQVSRWLILVLLLGTSFLAGMIAYGWRPWVRNHEATALVHIPCEMMRMLGESELSGPIPHYESYVLTQVSLIQSPAILQRVLDEETVMQTKWYRSCARLGKRGTSPLESLRGKLEVRPRAGTELVEVTVADPEPAEAKLLADTIVQHYIRMGRSLVDEGDHRLHAVLQDQYIKIKKEIEALTYQRRMGADSEVQDLAALGQRQQDLEVDLARLKRECKLLEWELETAMSQPAPSVNSNASEGRAESREYLEHQLARKKIETELLELEMKSLRQRAAQVDRQAQVVAQQDIELRWKRERLEEIRRRIETLELEDRLLRPISVASLASISG